MSFTENEGSWFTPKQETDNIFLPIFKTPVFKDGKTKGSLTEDKKTSLEFNLTFFHP